MTIKTRYILTPHPRRVPGKSCWLVKIEKRVFGIPQIFISLRSKAKRGSGLLAGVMQGFLFDDFSPIPSSELPK